MCVYCLGLHFLAVGECYITIRAVSVHPSHGQNLFHALASHYIVQDKNDLILVRSASELTFARNSQNLLPVHTVVNLILR